MSCDNLVEAYFPLTNRYDCTAIMGSMFLGCGKLQSINMSEYTDDVTKIAGMWSFRECTSLKDIYFDVEIEEKNWSLYSLKRTGNSVILKKYNLANNTLVNEKVIDCGNCDYSVTLFYKTDELLIDRNGDITEDQIELLLKNKWEFGDKFVLDPNKKWLVIWSNNPNNVKSNCFVTQKEFRDLRAKLKKCHPDLF